MPESIILKLRNDDENIVDIDIKNTEFWNKTDRGKIRNTLEYLCQIEKLNQRDLPAKEKERIAKSIEYFHSEDWLSTCERARKYVHSLPPSGDHFNPPYYGSDISAFEESGFSREWLLSPDGRKFMEEAKSANRVIKDRSPGLGEFIIAGTVGAMIAGMIIHDTAKSVFLGEKKKNY